jgi:hypothetical protein
MSDFISPELIEQFNKAAQLAREGKYEESLAEWNLLLFPSKKEKRNNSKMMSGHFLGIAMMRRAWVLIDLKNYKEAKRAFEDDVMKACLTQFSNNDLYEYFFSYGNTLGELGDINGMDDAFSRAINIAANELGDLSRCEVTWKNLMSYAENSNSWEYLERESNNALTFAQNSNSEVLKFEARWYHILALKGLNLVEKAREEAELMLKDLQKIGADKAVNRLQDLIDSL